MTLTQLGSKTAIPESPDAAILEKIPVSRPGIRKSVVRFSCPEFTSLCPVTGQPDFARFYIDFIPNKWLVESKSLKLFLTSFRNHGAFHEEVTVVIAERVQSAIEPSWIRVAGIWFPRGGIPIDVFFQDGNPGNVFIPQLRLNAYSGR